MAEVTLGIATVCHINRQYKDDNARAQIYANVCMTVNLGISDTSANQSPASFSPLLENLTMVVSMDVTHPGLGVIKPALSVPAVVASHDKH